MIQPILKNVVIEPIDVTQRHSGIILTPSNDEVRRGKVLAIGIGKWAGGEKGYDIPSVVVGDIVLFRTYAPLITEGSEKVYIIDNDEILAIIK